MLSYRHIMDSNWTCMVNLSLKQKQQTQSTTLLEL